MKYAAPLKFAAWMSSNEHKDKKLGHIYRYHGRSDSHSIALCQFIVEDLLTASEPLRQASGIHRVVFGVNLKHTFTQSAKSKTLDLALGYPVEGYIPSLFEGPIDRVYEMRQVILACEAKTAMTEHGKSQPRIFDELSSSHEIVHRGDNGAIAAGVTVVNIANRFISPLRQKPGVPIHWSKHKQPHATEKMTTHLRGLPIRDKGSEVGFDAYTTIVINCDNEGPAGIWETTPAPQPGDRDHYDTFIDRIVARLNIILSKES